MSSLTGEGLSGGLHTTLPVAMTISAFTAIAWCNSLELNVRIWMAFKRHNGLYFWSLQIASWGVILYSLAFLVKFFQVINNNYISVTGVTIGWWSMVTGQSLVLYSRLHLVMRDPQRIRWVLYMIIIDAILFHTPTTLLTFGVSPTIATSRSASRHILTAHSQTRVLRKNSPQPTVSWRRSSSLPFPSKSL